MIFISPELKQFVVEPWMNLEPFDPKLIKKIQPNHPYKILLSILYKYYPEYNGGEGDEDNGEEENEDVSDLYFKMLDDYTRYGIAFERDYYLFPDNKLGVIGDKNYSLVENSYNKKTLLFNKVKTIDLKQHDRGEKPLSEKEKSKRDLIKKLKDKKFQVAMMDPDIYNNDELFEKIIQFPTDKLLLEKLDHRTSWHGIRDFLRINFD